MLSRMQIIQRWKNSRLEATREAQSSSILRVFWPFELSSQLKSAENSHILYGCVIPHKGHSTVENVAYSVVVMGAHPASPSDPRACARLQQAIKQLNHQLAKQPTNPMINNISIIGEWLLNDDDCQPSVAPPKQKDNSALWLTFKGLIDCQQPQVTGSYPAAQEIRRVPQPYSALCPPTVENVQLQTFCYDTPETGECHIVFNAVQDTCKHRTWPWLPHRRGKQGRPHG